MTSGTKKTIVPTTIFFPIISKSTLFMISNFYVYNPIENQYVLVNVKINKINF